jgi:hypothetical protein
VLLADDASPTVAAVKVVLATVVLGLAGYQAVLAAVVYGRLRSLGLARRVAARAHRLVGATATALMVAVGAVCLSAYDVGDAVEDGGGAAVHAVAGCLLLVLMAVKIVVVHLGRRAGRALPVLGVTALGLVAVTWATSALPVLT